MAALVRGGRLAAMEDAAFLRGAVRDWLEQ